MLIIVCLILLDYSIFLPLLSIFSLGPGLSLTPENQLTSRHRSFMDKASLCSPVGMHDLGSPCRSTSKSGLMKSSILKTQRKLRGIYSDRPRGYRASKETIKKASNEVGNISGSEYDDLQNYEKLWESWIQQN